MDENGEAWILCPFCYGDGGFDETGHYYMTCRGCSGKGGYWLACEPATMEDIET